MAKIEVTQYQRGCVHDDEFITMHKLAEGTKTNTKNGWVLTCHLGPTWVWHNKSKDWILFNGSVNWIDVELPFEQAYELLQTLKTKKQIEQENKK